MIVYNVTIKTANEIADAWLQWLKEDHIPDIINTGCFTHAIIHRLADVDDTDGPTYVIQYHAASQPDYENYISNFATSMRQKAFDKWGNKFIAFRTVMHIVN